MVLVAVKSIIRGFRTLQALTATGFTYRRE